jgi:hypothetical protein
VVGLFFSEHIFYESATLRCYFVFFYVFIRFDLTIVKNKQRYTTLLCIQEKEIKIKYHLSIYYCDTRRSVMDF